MLQRRVVNILPGSSLAGGVGTYVKFLVECLPDYEHIVMSDGVLSAGNGAQNIKVPGFTRVPSILSLIKILNLMIRDYRSDSVIIVHSTAGLLAGILLSIFRFQVISVIHGRASKYSGFLTRLVEKSAVKLSGCTVFMNKSDTVGLNIKCSKIVYNCLMKKIDNSRLYESELDDIPHRVVVVARHSPQKNISIIAETAKLNPDIFFFVYGDGPNFDDNSRSFAEIENLIFKKKEAAHKIYWHGALFVLPTYSEGFPLSAMEAASSQMPLILSDINELREIFSNYAQYFDNNDAHSLSELIQSFSNKPEAYTKWASRSNLLTQIYSKERFSTSWKKIIEEAL